MALGAAIQAAAKAEIESDRLESGGPQDHSVRWPIHHAAHNGWSDAKALNHYGKGRPN